MSNDGASTTGSPNSHEEEVQELDNQYTTFPSFEEWTRSIDRSELASWGYFEDLVGGQQHETSQEELLDAIETVIRAAAFDTGAVEDLYPTDRGTTISVATRAPRWEDVVEERGTLTRRLFDAQLGVYKRLSGWDGSEPITEATVRSLHADLCEPQKTYTVYLLDGTTTERPLVQGSYKELPNHVIRDDGTRLIYAPVSLVPHEMRRLVEEIGTTAFDEAHAITQAAYVHYCVTVVHPFADGNGRVARALASAYFYRAFGLPLLLFLDQRPGYRRALSAADAGDYGSFNSYVYDRAVGAVMLLMDTLSPASTIPGARETGLRLGSLLDASEAHARLDTSAAAVYDLTREALDSAISHLVLPDKVKSNVANRPIVPTSAPPEYRASSLNRAIMISLTVSGPASARIQVVVAVVVSLDHHNPLPLGVVSSIETLPMLQIPRGELGPGNDGSLRWRLDRWATRLSDMMLVSLHDAAKQSLSKRGMSTEP
jgi:hypothetical protein